MPLQFASALKLKTILQPLVGKHGNILANERTNTLIITDISSNIKRLATIISQMERPLPPEIQVKTFVLNYGDAEKISQILNDLSKDDKDLPYPSPGSNSQLGSFLEIYGEIQAYPEVETSSIVVASAPVNFPAIESLIQELDIFPPQAMIEVVIMDVTLDDDFEMGIEFSDATTPSLTTKGYQTNLSGDGGLESTFHSLLGLATSASTAGFTYRVLNSKETVQALGLILNTQENSKVLSTPKILASNNQESSITVGQEIPIIQSSTTDLVNNVTNVDFRYEDVGLILKVTPRISRDGYVNMKVHAELKDLSAQTLLNASIINKREADANVIIPDGHTVILGGLMRDNDSLVEQKIPILGDIPILGVVFKKTQTALLKTELIIFLTPHVINNTQDLIDITSKPSGKYKAIKDAQRPKDLKKAVSDVVDYKSKKYYKKKDKEAKAKKKLKL
jgi:general secretion pathway protein D